MTEICHAYQGIFLNLKTPVLFLNPALNLHSTPLVRPCKGFTAVTFLIFAISVGFFLTKKSLSVAPQFEFELPTQFSPIFIIIEFQVTVVCISVSLKPFVLETGIKVESDFHLWR